MRPANIPQLSNRMVVDWALNVRAASLGGVRASSFGSAFSATEGGYAVPVDFATQIFAQNERSLLPFCDVIPASSAIVETPVDGTLPWESSAIQSVWTDEGTAPVEQIPNLSMTAYRLKKLVVVIPVSEELAADAPALAIWLPTSMKRAVTWEINNSIINGLGAGRPLGILNAPSLVVADAEPGQAAGTITAANVGKMIGRCLDVEDARWIMNPDAFGQVVQTSLWDGGTKTLAGLPVFLTEACPALGAQGDIILTNLSGYRVATRNEKFTESSHMHFDRDLKVFRLSIRIDGSPILAAPTTPPNSAVTRSHFVTLAARS